jgi:hypothetical protein
VISAQLAKRFRISSRLMVKKTSSMDWSQMIHSA